MSKNWREPIGAACIFLGITLGLLGLIEHKDLWQGIRTVTVEKVVTVTPPAPPNEHNTGPISVDIRYVDNSKNNAAIGQYQFLSPNNKIWVAKFCGEPYPDFKNADVVDIHYKTENGKDCSVFIDATVIKEKK